MLIALLIDVVTRLVDMTDVFVSVESLNQLSIATVAIRTRRNRPGPRDDIYLRGEEHSHPCRSFVERLRHKHIRVF